MEDYLKLFDDNAAYESASTKPAFSHVINEISILEKPIEPIYKWVEEGTICKYYNKYANLVEYVSTDNGKTWQQTGQSKQGDLIEKNSVDCGWVEHPEKLDYLYSDLTYGTTVKNNIIGVCIDSYISNGYARFIAIKGINNCDIYGGTSSSMAWGGLQCLNIRDTNRWNGKENTAKILADWDKPYDETYEDYKTVPCITPTWKGLHNYPAAAACWRFKTDGTNQGDWYLPATDEIGNELSNNMSLRQLDQKISAAGGETLSGHPINYYWTSTKADTYGYSIYVRELNGGNSFEITSQADNSQYLVRPIIKLTFDQISPASN